jgi:rare lipoprotein A
VIKFLINILFFVLLAACQIDNIKSPIKNITTTNISKINEPAKDEIKESKVQIINKQEISANVIKYVVEDSYFIDGVQHKPIENYEYKQIGLATYYGKELHNVKTVNNDFNKVTELLARHKTLPLPSIVKITNLENGLSIIVKINDRFKDNSSLIQVSRKSSQLLKFYKDEIARVRVEIVSDPSKQMKIVTQSMNEAGFNDTISSAPTELVSISNLDDEEENGIKKNKIVNEPISIGYEVISLKNLFLIISDFKSKEELNITMLELDNTYNFLFQKKADFFNAKIGPLSNKEANKLVLTFISKGYKNYEFILE